MSFITVGLDENKTYNRAVPPGGHTSNWTVFNYDNKQETNLNNNQTAGVTSRRAQHQVDNVSVGNLRRSEGEHHGDSRQKRNSRFTAALEQPLIDLNTTEKTRTPRGLLRLGVPGEAGQAQPNMAKPPPGGGTSDFWGNM